ncbi:PREDICTED: uncharacterized protein LOC106811829 [Priapulus caudatus]|uniref:Uncharacterized protein LOC106811829 n=1 Tax=Priapulus caudatus TaxID=37621 RepID=A0ABM1EFR6_PRICU|nr:PREDICTED: uncharacterized protein LOC106811829 [Priapulus caudatus]
MATVKVIGRRTTFRGKTLFEILCNLKNFGKGRVVVRSLFEDRFPTEPSYYVITRAAPEMDENFDFGEAWGRKVFRGNELGEWKIMAGHKADWRLIPRDDEHKYLNWKPAQPFVHSVIPREQPFPPLLREIIRQEMKAAGKSTDKEALLPISIHETVWNRAKLRRDATPAETNTSSLPTSDSSSNTDTRV